MFVPYRFLFLNLELFFSMTGSLLLYVLVQQNFEGGFHAKGTKHFKGKNMWKRLDKVFNRNLKSLIFLNFDKSQTNVAFRFLVFDLNHVLPQFQY